MSQPTRKLGGNRMKFNYLNFLKHQSDLILSPETQYFSINPNVLYETYQAISAHLDSLGLEDADILQGFVPKETTVETQNPKTADLSKYKLSTIVSLSMPYPAYDSKTGKQVENREQDCISTLRALGQFVEQASKSDPPKDDEVFKGEVGNQLKTIYFASKAYASIAGAAALEHKIRETIEQAENIEEIKDPLATLVQTYQQYCQESLIYINYLERIQPDKRLEKIQAAVLREKHQFGRGVNNVKEFFKALKSPHHNIINTVQNTSAESNDKKSSLKRSQ